MKLPFNIKNRLKTLLKDAPPGINENDDETFSVPENEAARKINEALAELTAIINRENALLESGLIDDIASLYPEKERSVEKLEKTLQEFAEESKQDNEANMNDLLEMTREGERLLQSAIEKNRQLLKQRHEEQEQVMKIIVDTAREQTRSGSYGKKNTGNLSGNMGLTLNGKA